MPALAIVSPRRLWDRYNDALMNSPVKTKALTSMGCFALGDVMAQLVAKNGTLRERCRELDGFRCARMAGFGLLFTGPVGHHFYDWLDKTVMPTHPKHPTAVVSKVAFDQLIYTPLVTTTFFIYTGLASNKRQEIPSEITTKLWPTTKVGWLLWVPAMSINMACVPGHLRLAFINVVSLAWTNILSRMASKQPAFDADACLVET